MKRILLAAAAIIVVAAAGVGVWLVAIPAPTGFAAGSRVALADYHGAPPTGVPAELAQASLIERGAYLTHAADCFACHSAPGGKPYAGGLAFNLPGMGVIYSTNITADKETGIGGYTDQQFIAALHRGIRADGKNLYPAMSYASYTYMTDDDALAIKAYLFSQPVVHAPARQNQLQFPFDQRWLMAIWNIAYNADSRFRPNPVTKPGMEPRRLSCRGARALRRMPHPAESGLHPGQPGEVRRRDHGWLARL